MSFWTQFRDTVLQKTGITKNLPKALGGRAGAAINNLQRPKPQPVVNTAYQPPTFAQQQVYKAQQTADNKGSIYVILGGVAAAFLLYQL